jgi:hypothetical protein
MGHSQCHDNHERPAQAVPLLFFIAFLHPHTPKPEGLFRQPCTLFE